MNAAGVMARVYDAVKAEVMAGRFAPGERIDPARLAPDLAASVTPIRDALYRLAGERLVENWQSEGFRQPIVTEASLRDLYRWSDELLQVILRAAARNSSSTNQPSSGASDYVNAVASKFEWLANLSDNREHRAAVASLNDRSHSVRAVEPNAIAAALSPLVDLVEAVAEQNWQEARRLNGRYHAARLRAVPVLAGLMRPR